MSLPFWRRLIVYATVSAHTNTPPPAAAVQMSGLALARRARADVGGGTVSPDMRRESSRSLARKAFVRSQPARNASLPLTPFFLSQLWCALRVFDVVDVVKRSPVPSVRRLRLLARQPEMRDRLS